MDFLIDDRWENVQEFIQDSNKRAILFEKPWNTSKEDNYDEVGSGLLQGYIRKNNWKEIVDHFTFLKKEGLI